MAYNVYAFCDECGKDLENFTNVTVSMTRFRKYAKARHWDVRNGWLCPDCAKKKLNRKEQGDSNGE